MIPTAPTPARPVASGPAAPLSRTARKIQKQVDRAGLSVNVGTPDSSIFSEPVLALNQKGKLLELRAEFAIFDRHGRQLAAVRGKRLSDRVQVVDMAGRTLLELRRESTRLSSKMTVTDEYGSKVGRLVTSFNLNQVSRAYKLDGPDDRRIGAVFFEDRGRHRDFNVQDAQGSVAARITKTHAGLAKELFTKGDNYVIEFPGQASTTLRMLAIAAALVVDRTYHQR